MAENKRFGFVLSGHKEFERMLRELPQKVTKYASRRAVTRGASPMVKAIKRLVPRVTGWLKKSIKAVVRSYPSGVAVAVIGADRAVAGEATVKLGRGKNRKVRKLGRRVPFKYLHLVEGGHGGPHPAKPHPFFEKGVKETEAQSQAIMKAVYIQVLEEQAKKLAKK